MGFSRQEYWSRRLCPSSRDLAKPGNKSDSVKSSALAGGFFTTSTTWDLPNYHYSIAICQHPYSQSYGFSSSHVWMCELDHKENWAPKNWCSSIVMLEKTPESPLACKEIKFSILKEINPEYLLKWLLLKLRLWSFGHMMQIANSLEKTLMLRKIEGKRRRG